MGEQSNWRCKACGTFHENICCMCGGEVSMATPDDAIFEWSEPFFSLAQHNDRTVMQRTLSGFSFQMYCAHCAQSYRQYFVRGA